MRSLYAWIGGDEEKTCREVARVKMWVVREVAQERKWSVKRQETKRRLAEKQEELQCGLSVRQGRRVNVVCGQIGGDEEKTCEEVGRVKMWAFSEEGKERKCGLWIV